MSFITGVLHVDGAPATADDVAELGADHDGPTFCDYDGIHCEGPLAFRWQIRWTTPEAVHERLPIVSADGRFVLCYSGRLDNRDELIARFHLPRHFGDGALLAEAFARDGSAGLRHCVGDFVMAVWDRVERRLSLARDAIGHRPLFYVLDRGRLTWSTDFRALRRGPARGSRPNAGFLAEHLSGATVSLDETVFADIRRVPAAHALMISQGQSALASTAYWTPPSELPPRRADSDLIDEFFDHLSTAVKACLRSYGSAASELSGGLDSSSIVALTTEFTGTAPDTYSMVFPGQTFAPGGQRLDESEFIDAMTSNVGAASFRHDPRAATAADVLRVLRVHGDVPDWPNADLVRWPMIRAASDHGHRVLLNGVGGDQWLTGTVARLPALLFSGRFAEARAFFHAATNGPNALELYRGALVKRVAVAAVPAWARRLYRVAKPAHPWPRWLTTSCVEGAGLSARLRALPERVPPTRDAVMHDSLTRFAGGEGVYFREGMFRTSNDAGVESRHPFSNRGLVEFMLTLPDDLRFRDGQTRFIFRRAMGDRLPAAVSSRLDKGDGSLLITRAIEHVLPTLPMRSLHLADAGWVDGDVLRAAIERFLASPAPRAPQVSDADLWASIAVEAWLRSLDAPAG